VITPCSKCGQVDQIVSVNVILTTPSSATSSGTGLIIGEGGVTPVISNSSYTDKGLQDLQDKIHDWIDKPLPAVKYSGSASAAPGWLLVASAWVIPGLGIVSGLELYFLGIPLLIAGIIYLSTLNKRRAKIARGGSPEALAESKARRNGWYCTRCGTLMKNS
jgi:hypothetical protein